MNIARRSTTPRRTNRIFALLALAMLALMSVPLSPAMAQESKLDQSVIIDGLTREGMSELLLHMLEVDPPRNPVVAKKVEIAQLKLQFAQSAERAQEMSGQDPEQAAQLQQQAIDAFEEAIRQQQALIDDPANADHVQRAIWQLDLAEMLLFQYLRGVYRNADAFSLYGVPTAEQQEAFEFAVAEATKRAQQADEALFELQGKLGRDDQLAAELTSSGLRFRLLDDYGAKRLPFYQAYSAALTARLGDDSDYFQNLGSFSAQQKTPEDERKRLLQVALEQSRPMADDKSDESGVRTPSMWVRSLALVDFGQPGEAISEYLDPLMTENREAFESLLAGLTKTEALLDMKQLGQALDVLASLEEHPLVISDPMNRLLVTDMLFRVMMDQAAKVPAEQKQEAVAAAYQVYVDMLDNSAVADSKGFLQGYIYERWANDIDADTDPKTLPAVVRLAVGQLARGQGQNLAIIAANEAESEQQAEELRSQALEKLERAITMLTPNTADGIADDIRAQSMFNLALSHYFKDPQDLGNLLKTTDLLTQLATEMPDQPISEDSISNAIAMLIELHGLEQRPVGVEPRLNRAMETLLEYFPQSSAADNARFYYGLEILLPAGKTAEAVELFKEVPYTQADYFDARNELLFAMLDLLKEKQGAARAQLFNEISTLADQLMNEATGEMEIADLPARRASATRAVAGSRIVKARLAILDNKYDEALKFLHGFEQEYANEPGLVAMAFENRIMALMDAGRLKEAGDQSRAMMAAFPDDAAIMIDQVISRLDREIDSLRLRAAEPHRAETERQQLLMQAQNKAETAALLVEPLVNWAQKQDLNNEQMLPYREMQAKVLRLSGAAESAFDIMKPLAIEFPKDPGVLTELSEALYAMGQQAYALDKEKGKVLLVQASEGIADPNEPGEKIGGFAQLIKGLKDSRPPEYWNAWMRQLQIQWTLQFRIDEIVLRIRQLRETVDPNLGGPPYNAELKRLEDKAAAAVAGG